MKSGCFSGCLRSSGCFSGIKSGSLGGIAIKLVALMSVIRVRSSDCSCTRITNNIEDGWVVFVGEGVDEVSGYVKHAVASEDGDA
jgi:hypothetical protein